MIVKIGDVISEYSVRNKFDENIPVYSVTNEKGFCTGYFSKEVASKDKSTYKIVPRGYFAYNPSRINVGSVDWQKYEDRVIVSPLYVVFGVSDRLDRQYLLHYLKSDMMLSFIKEYATGSVRDSLKLADLGKFPINLRPLEEQCQIAAILDKIDDLIAKRRQQLDKLNELVKSRFIEMFGDPVTNSKGLVTRKGSEFFTLTNGKFVPEEKRRDEGIPAYGGNGISWYTDEILVAHDTIVVGRVGFQSGNVHFVTGPLWVTDNAMYISDFNKDQYDLRFLCALMEHIDFTRFQDAGDLKKITQKPFMQMSFIAPPIQQQKSFITFVEQVDKSKLAIQRILDKLEVLKKALMQEYFG